MARHGIKCPCRSCCEKFEGKGMVWDDDKRRYVKRSGSNNFSRDLPDGTSIYGPKSTEGRTGHKHGHRGDNFDRSPHSSVGSAAIGKPHNYEDHKKNRTKRW
jgi:hypothetical protein